LNVLFAEHLAASPPARTAMQRPLTLALSFSIGFAAMMND
jgi:hypothetical protein